MEKYLYFRTEADDIDNDDSSSSGVFPVSSLKGMHPTSDTAITLFFEPVIRNSGDGQDGNVVNNDSVVINVIAGRVREVMEAIIAEIAKPQIANSGAFIVVADDLTTTVLTSAAGADETVVPVVLNQYISSCGAITIATVLS
mgnify:CR=1 FL=1|tara:strand:+ start:221 stop:646 length:426 start_codon:yes stop_codon:yes gene_type:complete